MSTTTADYGLLKDIFYVPVKPKRRRPAVKSCADCRDCHGRRRPGPFYISAYVDRPFCADCRDAAERQLELDNQEAKEEVRTASTAYTAPANLAGDLESVELGFSATVHARESGWCYMVCGKSGMGGNHPPAFERVVSHAPTCKACIKRIAKARDAAS